MRENASISKEVRVDYELGCDRLSNLPLSVIHDILTRFPIQDAIRTSILSRKWRFTWASLPQLVFGNECVSISGDDATDETRLVHFITRSLLHHEGPIHRVEIVVEVKEIEPKIDMWVLCLSRKDIRELTMVFGESGGGYSEMSVYAPLLAEMRVLLTDFDVFAEIDQEEESSLRNYTNFFGGCTNLEKLVGYEYFTKFLSMGIEYCSHSVLLCNLKIVDLQDVNSEDDKEIMAVARLIMGAPNLNQLKIEFIRGDDESEDGNVCIRDFLCAQNFSFEKLRFIRISHLNALFPEKELIKFLLESSPVLETMRIGHFIRSDIDKIQSVVDDLLGCCRASPSARISIS